MKKNYFVFLAIFMCLSGQAQDIRLKKGVINRNLPLTDSIGQNLEIFLPSYYDSSRKWPVLFICDITHNVSPAMRLLQGAAETNGYVLASTRALADSIPLTTNVMQISGSLDLLAAFVPMNTDRLYVAGFGDAGEFAALMPNLMTAVDGVLEVDAAPPNQELISNRKDYDYVSLLSRAEAAYLSMLDFEDQLGRKGISNHVLYYNGDRDLPSPELLNRGLQTLTVLAMRSGREVMDTTFIREVSEAYLQDAYRLRAQGNAWLAYDRLEEASDLFDDTEQEGIIKDALREIRRTGAYSSQRREAANLRLREEIMRDDYLYYLEEDLISFNLENLGWWRFQMENIKKFQASGKREEKLMGLRLESYVTDLADFFIRGARSSEMPDDDALVFLYMLKTIIVPQEAENYLEVISLTSKYSDFGTALFYLEELLKTGYSDKERLYDLEHTALLRITPEFNALVEKYLKEARYEIPEPPGGEYR